MEDAQVPADSDDKGEARRPGMRLRDAETVAATRRDMFGDGSLLDTLAGSPAAPEHPEGVPDAAPAEPPDPPVPEAASAGEHGDPSVADPFPPGQLASFPQSLDDIIDSFPAGPSARDPDRPGPQGTSSGFLPPPRLTALDHGLGRGGHASDDPSLAAPPGRMEVSAIFNTLSPLEGHTEETQLGAEAVASPSDESTAGLPQTAPAQADGSHGDTGTGVAPEPSPLAAAPALEPLMLPPLPEIPGPPHPETDGMPPFSDADMPQFAEPLRRGGAAPYLEPPAYSEDPDTASGQGYPEPMGMPQFAEPLRRGGTLPYSEDPAYSEDPDTASDKGYPEPMGMPQFAAPLRIGGASPYSETPAYSEYPATAPFSEAATEVADVPPYSEPPRLPPFSAAAEVPEAPEIAPSSPPPLFHSTVDSAAETVAAPMYDAAAKIAAEASATAEALDNLNRRLTQNVPDADATQPRPLRHGYAQMHFRPDPAPFAYSPPALLMPLPVPPHQERSKSIYLLGFLTGLGLSLMAGIALYVLINTG